VTGPARLVAVKPLSDLLEFDGGADFFELGLGGLGVRLGGLLHDRVRCGVDEVLVTEEHSGERH